MTAKHDVADSLEASLGAPIYNDVIKKWVGRGELHYEKYVRTTELLSLQTPGDELVIPDELMFQIVHQSQELWLKLASHEAVRATRALSGGDAWAAMALLERMKRIVEGMTAEIHVLETMTPLSFQVVRRSLGMGSGLESPGYNQLTTAAEALKGAFEALLLSRQVTLLDVYREPGGQGDLLRIAEALLDLDETFQHWLTRHFMLVRRTIGVDKTVRALDGFPTMGLAARMIQPLFPTLWDVRVEMTRTWKREGGYEPGEARRAAGVSGTMRAQRDPGDEPPDDRVSSARLRSGCPMGGGGDP